MRSSDYRTILAIETSCDETAVAIVREGQEVLSSAVLTQIPLHQRFGGVVPEVAARAHIEGVQAVLEQSLKQAFGTDSPQKLLDKKIDALAVTNGPGLIGSLLVGVTTARTLAASFDKPLIPVHHILGHIYSNFLQPAGSNSYRISRSPHLAKRPNQVTSSYSFPFLTLVASGGHTELILSQSHTDHRIIGQTLDDAAGEAFDKAAKILGLPYPGGQSIGRAAKGGDPQAFSLPRALAKEDSFNFSFSGLKTAIAQLVYTLESSGKNVQILRADLAASFQAAVVDILVIKTIRAAKEYNIQQVNLAGGVAANIALRQALKQACDQAGNRFHVPDSVYCTDNAAMIGAAAYAATLARSNFSWYDVGVERHPKLA